jgi:hypothetical protein
MSVNDTEGLYPQEVSPMCQLPEEIAISIALMLGRKDISSLGQTCRSWRAACNSDDLWKFLYAKRWPEHGVEYIPRSSSGKASSAQQLSSLKKSLVIGPESEQKSADSTAQLTWKERFMGRLIKVVADEKVLIDLLDNFPTFEVKTSRSIEVCRMCFLRNLARAHVVIRDADSNL